MSIRNALTAAAAVLAIGAAAPAMAQSGGGSSGAGDTNIENFVRQSPKGMAPTTNGTPRIIDNRNGQPVIEYSGPRGPGVQDGGTPRIIDNRDGQPVISYGGEVPGDSNSSAMQEAASQNRARPGMRGTPAANAANSAVASQVGPLLSSARASLQRGRYAAAATSLEQAETRLLNSGVDRADMRDISEARAAAYRGDRNRAMQSLNSAMQQMNAGG
jgi:hypothetical protein